MFDVLNCVFIVIVAGDVLFIVKNISFHLTWFWVPFKLIFIVRDRTLDPFL